MTATRIERPEYRTPISTDVVLKEAIQMKEPTISLNESLQGIPGLVVNNRQNYALGERLIMRGIGSRAQFGIRGIKILVDDIPITLPDGQTQPSNIDLITTGRIEVLRGPVSSLYGNAAGGVIHFHTEDSPRDSPYKIHTRGEFGSFGLQKWAVKARVKNPVYEYVIGANQMTTDGFRDHSASKTQQVNAIWRAYFSRRLSLTAMANLYNAPYLLNPSTLEKSVAHTDPASVREYIIQQGAAEQATQGQAGFTVRYEFGEGEYLRGTIYNLQRSLINPIPGRVIRLNRLVGGVRSLYHKPLRLFSGEAALSLGLDFESQDDGRTEFMNNGLPEQRAGQVAPDRILDFLDYGDKLVDQDEQVYGIGPFLQFELTLFPKTRVLAGGRYDQYLFIVRDKLTNGEDKSGARNMGQFSPMVGMTYSLNQGLTMYGNFSTAFQTPTTAELGNRPTGEGGFNPELHPEKIRSFEIGARGRPAFPNLKYDLAAYVMNIRDMLIPYQIDPMSDEVFHENAGAARNAGVEAKLIWRLGPRISTMGSYTFQHFTFQDYVTEYSAQIGLTRKQLAGKKVPGVPEQQLYWQLSYQRPSGFYAELQTRWMDSYYTNNFNGPPPQSDTEPVDDYINDAFAVVNLRVGHTLALGRHAIRLTGGVNDLLDARYNASIIPNAFGGRFFEPAPGQNWFAGIEFIYTGLSDER